MIERPDCASRCMSFTFVDVGRIPAIFCRPSRGPTSTILTVAMLGEILFLAGNLMKCEEIDSDLFCRIRSIGCLTRR